MRIIVLTVVALAICVSSIFAQQNPPGQPGQGQQAPAGPPTVDATVQEIKETGRTKTLVVVNAEGQTMDIPLGRIPVDIKAGGDNGFVRPGAYIAAEGVLTNDALFVSEVNVLIPMKGQKLPRGMVKKAPRQAGSSVNSYQIMGTITAMKPNPDYPDYTMFLVDAPGKIPVINLEKNFRVKVTSNNAEQLETGMAVVLEGRVVRNKFVPSKITANRAEPFKSEDVFGAPAEGEGGASAETGTSAEK